MNGKQILIPINVIDVILPLLTNFNETYLRMNGITKKIKEKEINEMNHNEQNSFVL